MTFDLFAEDCAPPITLGPQAALLPRFALADAPALQACIAALTQQSPWRHMHTPGGKAMGVATTSCGAWGWISDAQGYRYAAVDPITQAPWPAMPGVLTQLAQRAAAAAGFEGFTPDSCLINRYAPGVRLSLHQDRDERDLQAPIVSVSLGLSATFLWGGLSRSAPQQRVPLHDGDVVVWGGADRLRFHGVAPVRPSTHALTGGERINFTLRRAGHAPDPMVSSN